MKIAKILAVFFIMLVNIFTVFSAFTVVQDYEEPEVVTQEGIKEVVAIAKVNEPKIPISEFDLETVGQSAKNAITIIATIILVGIIATRKLNY